MKAKEIIKMIEGEINAIDNHIADQRLLLTRLQKLLNKIKETRKEKPKDAIL